MLINCYAFTDPIGAHRPTLNALHVKLRGLLLALSPTQVSHLAASVQLNSPPNGLSYHTVKQEIISLSKPSRSVRSDTQDCDEISTRIRGLEEEQTAATANRTCSSLLGRKSKSAPLPATQDVVMQAKTALIEWQQRREDEWAIEWCHEAAGVELKLGVLYDEEEDD